MKKSFVGTVLAVVCLACALNVQAIPLTDTVDFCGDGTYLGESYKAINGGLFRSDFYYTLDLGCVPPGSTLNSASLSITHVGNVSSFFNPELWMVSGENVYLGNLSKSEWGCWTTDTFELDEAMLRKICDSDPWSLRIKLDDDTWGSDCLWLDESSLCADYSAPVPEPGSFMLFGGGLLSFVGLHLKKKLSRAA